MSSGGFRSFVFVSWMVFWSKRKAIHELARTNTKNRVNGSGRLWNGEVVETVLRDVRYGFRSLLKHPGFTALVILTLALGVGATTAIFSVVNTVVLRPLPYPNADRVVAIQELDPKGKRVQVTPANFLDWRAQNTVFQHLAAILTRPANLSVGRPGRAHRPRDGVGEPV